MLKTILTISLDLLALGLILAVLVQQRGTGLGRSFGGSNAVYRVRRGAERFIFNATIVLAICFVGVTIALYLI